MISMGQAFLAAIHLALFAAIYAVVANAAYIRTGLKGKLRAAGPIHCTHRLRTACWSASCCPPPKKQVLSYNTTGITCHSVPNPNRTRWRISPCSKGYPPIWAHIRHLISAMIRWMKEVRLLISAFISRKRAAPSNSTCIPISFMRPRARHTFAQSGQISLLGQGYLRLYQRHRQSGQERRHGPVQAIRCHGICMIRPLFKGIYHAGFRQ
jgi:hypothetical protein